MARQTEFASFRIDDELNDKLLFIAEKTKSNRSKVIKDYVLKEVNREMKKYPPEQFEEWKANREQENK